jgi:RND family efflux transporter MFP subunit
VISNGKVSALRHAEIRFPIQESIKSIFVKNGDKVSKGQLLALLNPLDLTSKVERSRSAVEKSLIDLDDRLIDYGYRLKDSAKVPPGILRMAKTRSGYNSAVYDYTDTRTALNKTRIVAPFSGKISDLEAREFNNTDLFKKLCYVIDDSQMQVEFNVLESEYRFLSVGSSLSVIPYGTEAAVFGTVSQVNPVIDASGMIKITGSIRNTGDALLDGMSVKIVVKKAVAGKLFVPKEAVLQRQNRSVVFTYQNGRAKWNYVETGIENTRYVTILSGLAPGQQVIVHNNASLAHDAEVSIDESAATYE